MAKKTPAKDGTSTTAPLIKPSVMACLVTSPLRCSGVKDAMMDVLIVDNSGSGDVSGSVVGSSIVNGGGGGVKVAFVFGSVDAVGQRSKVDWSAVVVRVRLDLVIVAPGWIDENCGLGRRWWCEASLSWNEDAEGSGLNSPTLARLYCFAFLACCFLIYFYLLLGHACRHESRAVPRRSLD